MKRTNWNRFAHIRCRDGSGGEENPTFRWDLPAFLPERDLPDLSAKESIVYDHLRFRNDPRIWRFFEADLALISSTRSARAGKFSQ